LSLKALKNAYRIAWKHQILLDKKRVASPLFLMALTIFLDFMGFGLIIPLLPFWAEHLGANPFDVGLLLTVYALAQFVCTPILGTLSDRYGRRRVILISLGIEVLAFALTALASSLPLLLLARVIGGIGASNLGSAQAVVSDVTPPQKRAAGMGMIGAAIGMGFVIGPVLGGLFSSHGSPLPFWIAMGLALLNALLVLFLLPETRGRQAGVSFRKGGLNGLVSGWSKAIHQREIASLVLVNLLYTLAFSGMEAVFALLTQHTLGWSAVQNGYLFTYIGIIVVLMQGGLLRRLVKRWGERSLMLAGLFLLSLGLLLLVWSSSLALLLLATGILSLGDGAVTPTSCALLSLVTPADEQGKILGVSQGLGSLGRTIGPLLAGVLFTLNPGAPFLVGALCAGLAILVTLPVMTRIQVLMEIHKKKASVKAEINLMV
jgi:multidrug resistance protein